MSSSEPERGMGRFARGVTVAHPGRFRPGFVRSFQRYVGPFLKVFHRPTLEGVEHLPPSGPYLLVGNHPSGTGITPLAAFANLWFEKVGADRPLAGFVLPLGFHVFPINRVHRAIGAIPSTYAAAEAALAQGVPVMVLPGSDIEGFRPFWKRERADFGGRVGFLRIARAAGVPVVPIGFRGTRYACPMLGRWDPLATLLVIPRLLGFKRWGLSLQGALVAALIAFLPIPLVLRLALVWLWLALPLSFNPWLPGPVRMRIGPPLASAELFPDADVAAPDDLVRALRKVEGAVQSLVDP